MTCTHDRTVLRLLHHGAGQPQCMECLFELLRSQTTSAERQMASLRGFASTLLSREARALRLSSRLLWHTPFLQRVVALLGDSMHHGGELQLDQKEKSVIWRPLLFEFASTIVAEEIRARESTSSGSFCPDLMEALVALVASRCEDKLPVLLVAHVLERLDSDVASVFLNRVQMSAPLLAAVVDMLVEIPDGLDTSLVLDPIAHLILRLAEQGFQSLQPHLTASSGRLSYLVSVTPPANPLATHLLAFYSLCALHPHLLQCLLSGDTAAHLRCLAQGVQMHVANSTGTLRGAAVSLIHELASAVPHDVAGSWLRTCYLAEWLVEVCAVSDDVSIRTAAARAISHFADDDKIMRQIQGFAADALFNCCADAISGAGAGSLEDRRGLLDMATCSLRRILSTDCHTPFSLEGIDCLLRAGCTAHLTVDGSNDSTLGFNIVECLLPAQLNVSSRPIDCVDAECLVLLSEQLETTCERTNVGVEADAFGILCVLLSTLARSSQSLRCSHGDDADTLNLTEDGRTQQNTNESLPTPSPQSLYQQIQVHLLKCSCALARQVTGSNFLAIERLVPALESVLWPDFSSVGSLSSTGRRVWPGSTWCNSVNELGKLLQPLLIAIGVAPDNSNMGIHRAAQRPNKVSHLISMLLAPALQAKSGEGYFLLMSPNELLTTCDKMLTHVPDASSQMWLAISALMHVVAHNHHAHAHTPQWIDRFEFSFLTCFLDCSEPWENSWMMQLPLRAIVFLSAAAARLSRSSASRHLNHDTATSVLLSTTRLRLQPVMSVIIQTENSLDEWYLLRTQASCMKDLELSLKWFLDAGDDASFDLLLRGMVQFEEKMRLRVTNTCDTSPAPSFLGSVAPSKQWLIARIVALLNNSPQWELPAFIHVASAMIVEDVQVGVIFLEHGGLAVIVDLWQAGTAAEALAELLMCLLSSVPATAFDRHQTALSTFCTALERASLSGAAAALPLASHLSTVALWREDVTGLASLSTANWLHLHIVCRLNGELHGLEETAWTAITLLLISASAACGGQLHSQSSGLMQLTQALGFHRASSWLCALESPIDQTRMSATLALAAAACASSRVLKDGCTNYILPGASELSLLVRAIVQNALSDCQILRDASYLAISALLTCCFYPEQVRARLLHSASGQEEVLHKLLKGNVIEIDSDSISSEIETTTLSTTPALLYTLMILRSSPSWLERSSFMPHALPLARIARKDVCLGRSSQRLLAMRVLEFLLAADVSSLPPCSAAILLPLVDDDSVWLIAAREATAADDSWRCLNLFKDSAKQYANESRQHLNSSRHCLNELHHGVMERLCIELSK